MTNINQYIVIYAFNKYIYIYIYIYSLIFHSAPQPKGWSPGRVCRSSQRCVPGGLRLASRLHARGRLSGEHSCKRLCERHLRRYQARDSSGSFSHDRVIHVVARCLLSTAGTSAYRVALGLVSIWKPISVTYDHVELESGSTNDVTHLLPEWSYLQLVRTATQRLEIAIPISPSVRNTLYPKTIAGHYRLLVLE